MPNEGYINAIRAQTYKKLSMIQIALPGIWSFKIKLFNSDFFHSYYILTMEIIKN